MKQKEGKKGNKKKKKSILGNAPISTAPGSHSTFGARISLTVKCQYLACPASRGNISCVSSRGKRLTEPERNAGGSGTHWGQGNETPGKAVTAAALHRGQARYALWLLGLKLGCVTLAGLPCQK